MSTLWRRALWRVLAALFLALGLTTAAMALLPDTGNAAASACSISKWNVKINGATVSGGCTCYVAERVGKPIPWSGNAGDWYGNATWSKNANEPRTNSIAGFSYGHVAWIDSTSKISSQDTNVRQERVQTGTRSYWAWKGWHWVWVVEPVYSTITTKTVVETYRVNSSQRDYQRSIAGDNSIRYSNWTATKTYTVRNGQAGGAIWNTPRTGAASGLQGYIYP